MNIMRMLWLWKWGYKRFNRKIAREWLNEYWLYKPKIAKREEEKALKKFSYYLRLGGEIMPFTKEYIDRERLGKGG